MSAEEVAKAFTGHYYVTFDSNVDGLAGLFNEKSMMTFEGNQIMGSPAIMQKLKSLGQVKHTAKTMDIQPSVDGKSIVIFVTGHIAIGDPNGNPLHFSEFFHLVCSGPGQYYVHNCVFRLNYGL
mmetsp:Transcript_9206/g.19325  ORF Transcript_9206/g.19325 Transcript_9206/m.19325 type:complete len:124 (-) Transcript_9206:465-836(-)|eukprot:CAMPEP_0201124242 /NCGR_PEP_ID=MMETSP0850-20130426/10637_1 /ASSEMBLY_ACC=CAM_ASM_000622 /TAXON_ID=183588 /ORGANISM="Pseudo-nitzschia fraudulenta, Strain WWA7" /LENGTH=123 /DNA_ID=CAMNT_0047391449 /DNA_START=60 /DNA_END=431 /DNA_ORIENTATION=+